MTVEPLSQSQLQDYADCAYRYFLRYIRRIESASVQAEPVQAFETAVRRGELFHHLAQQYAVGVPAEALERTIEDGDVGRWWQQFLESGLDDLPPQRHAEITLVAPLAGRQISAKIDLLAVEPGRAVIVDWKTSRKPSIQTLKSRMQTRVYRWVVARSAGSLIGTDLRPEQIETRYWFAGDSDPRVSIAYSQPAFEADERELTALLQRIEADTEFRRTSDLSTCEVCAYRAIARPEVQPADPAELDDDLRNVMSRTAADGF